MTEHSFESPSVESVDVSPVTGPPTTDECLYLAFQLRWLGAKERLESAHRTPDDAYRAIVTHANDSPDDYLPDWPDGNWGGEVWGWNTEDGATYLIQQYRWSGLDTDDMDPFLTEQEVSKGENE